MLTFHFQSGLKYNTYRVDNKGKTENVNVLFLFRCSLPKAMSISRSEIFRKKKKKKKKRPENEKSWKVMGVQWEVIGGQRKVSGRSWEVNEGFWEVSGRSRGGHWRSLGG